MRVLLMDGETIGRWVEMRLALWPDTPAADHRAEVESSLAERDRYASFLCEDEAGVAAVSLKRRSATITLTAARPRPSASSKAFTSCPPTAVAAWRAP